MITCIDDYVCPDDFIDREHEVMEEKERALINLNRVLNSEEGKIHTFEYFEANLKCFNADAGLLIGYANSLKNYYDKFKELKDKAVSPADKKRFEELELKAEEHFVYVYNIYVAYVKDSIKMFSQVVEDVKNQIVGGSLSFEQVAFLSDSLCYNRAVIKEAMEHFEVRRLNIIHPFVEKCEEMFSSELSNI